MIPSCTCPPATARPPWPTTPAVRACGTEPAYLSLAGETSLLWSASRPQTAGAEALVEQAGRMKVRGVIRDLEAHGWRVRRQGGSHRVFRHPDHPDMRVVVAGNEGTEVPTGTLGAIYRQAGIDPPSRR